MSNNEIMNIYAEENDIVVYFFPQNGHDSDQEKADKHLVLGREYTVERTEVSSFSSKVYLKEVPDISFNTVLFRKAKKS